MNTNCEQATDLGYQLRARCKTAAPCSLSVVANDMTDPHFYEDGTPFYAWANAYQYPLNKSRVVQTARAFVSGYLYEYADTYGTVVSVNSTGSVSAIGNSLGPSDMCPTFSSISSGGNNVTDCKSRRNSIHATGLTP